MPEVDDNNLSVLGVLHAEVRLTGDDVRALGTKVDAFQGEMRSTISALIQAQNATNMQHASDIASLKARDDNQQMQIDAVRDFNEKGVQNRKSFIAIVISISSILIGLMQAIMNHLRH